MAQFLLRNTPDYRPTLIVQTCNQADDKVISAFKTFLLRNGCSLGLLFDPNKCLIIRDTFSAMEEDSFELGATFRTDAVMSKTKWHGLARSESLDRRVELWLHQLASKWEDLIPDDADIAAWFYSDIILHAAAARIEKRGTSQEENAA